MSKTRKLLESPKSTSEIVTQLTEMPTISKGDDGVVVADGKVLKKLRVEEVNSNIVVFREPKGNFLMPEGFTLVYFMDSEESAQEMRRGEIDYIIIPPGVPLGSFGRKTPFEKAFDKRHKDERKGIDKILGFLQGHSDEGEIYVDFMKVRKEFRRASINTKMVRALENNYPNAELSFSRPTQKGKKFIKKQYPNAPHK